MTQKFVVAERLSGALLLHEEWTCIGSLGITTYLCEDDMNDHPTTASTSSFTPSDLPPGWSALSEGVKGTAVNAPQHKDVPIDGRVGLLRGNYDPLAGVPFTGRAYWNVSDPATAGEYGPDYLMGACIGNLPTDYSSNPLLRAPIYDLKVRTGVTTTQGYWSYGSLPVVRLAPEGPFGDWDVWMEGCNEAC